MNTPPIVYTRLIKRVRAVLFDGLLMTLLLALLFGLVSLLGIQTRSLKLGIIVLPLVLFEPCLVAFTGGTVGQHWQKIRVTRRDGQCRIHLLAAIIRFIAKLLLGWLSFVTIFASRRHQAIHDFLVGSIVTHKDITALPAYECLTERRQDQENYIYPAVWRRVLVILLWIVLATIVYILLLLMGISSDCVVVNRCNAIDGLLSAVLNILWLVGVGWLIAIGWNGQLFGCRRRPRE